MATTRSSKFLTLIKVITVLSLILDKAASFTDKKTWTYELKSITSKVSDPEKTKINLEIKRVSRGVFAVSGTIMINYDLAEGDGNMVGAKSYRSTQGGDDYKILPFQVPEKHFLEFCNTYYKDVIMDTLKDCSDMWVFKDKMQLPVEKKTYTLDSCQFSQDGLPNHLENGLYKVVVYGIGDVDWEIVLIAEISSNY